MMQTRAFTINAQPQGDRRVKFIASTKAVDRHGTRLLPSGCRAENFRKNPAFLWGHNKDGEPDDVIGTVVELTISEEAVTALVEFDLGRKAQKCLRRVRRGVLRAVSVGFIPLRELPPDAEGVVDVVEWELCELSLVAVGSNPEALAVRSFTLKSARTAARTNPTRSAMNPQEIMSKLGIAEGAKPEEIAAALIKYLNGTDADSDKQMLVMGLLSMLAPAPSASSASDGARDAAMEAQTEEIRRLEARVAELETQKTEAEKKAEPTAEERAERACKAGQWPMAQRAALIEQFKAGKAPYLFPEKTFSTRGIRFTEGGNPAETAAKATPNFGSDKAQPALDEVDTLVLNIAKRAGLPVTPDKYAAERAARK